MLKNKCINIALAGNQNCGKTTFFNALTGKSKKTGNFPGVTVEKTFGYIKKNKEFRVYDLPGLYSLSCSTAEETVTESFLLSDETDVILNVIDSTNIERNLFLTFQLTKMKKPMVLIFNMADELERNGIKFDIEKFSALTGFLCLFTSASRGIDIDKITSLAKEGVRTGLNFRMPFSEEKEIYPLIESLCDSCLQKGNYVPYGKADKILLSKLFAFPVFISVITFIFLTTFSVSGKIAGYFSEHIPRLLFEGINIKNPILLSFLNDGILKGVFSVLSFLPVVLLLFFFLSLLEDSGYMARISFISDRIMKKSGLSGKAFFPAVMAFGCSVPAIMASRTLSCCEERKCMMKFIPFISCSAKLPVYIYICNLFFREYTTFIVLGIYLAGLIAGTAFITFSKKGQTDFILELPPYRIPTFKSTFSLMVSKTSEFLSRVFTVIVFVSVIIWGLSNFDFNLCVTDPHNSMLAHLSGKLEVLFAPTGLGDWRIISSLICGIGAKEAILSAITVLSAENIFTPASAISFLIFVLFYTPCISTLVTLKKESGSFLFALKTAIYQFVFAWAAAFVFYSFTLPFSIHS